MGAPAEVEEGAPSDSEPAPSPTTEPAVPEPAEEATAGAAAAWEHLRDHLSYRLFGDAYYMKDWTFPAKDQGISAAVPHRGLVYTNGFGVSFVGLDADYQRESFGATVNLRFGPSTPRLLTGPPAPNTIALENLKQGFVSWRPAGWLQLDLGQFDTIYGAEVSESFLNINYTRGALWVLQPFYHTGLRTVFAPRDWITVKALLINGTNSFLDPDPYPDGGLQVSVAPHETTSLTIGYLMNINPNATGFVDLSHLIDAIATFDAYGVRLVFNADLGIQTPQEILQTLYPTVYWGASLAAGYQIFRWLDVGGRAEVFHDPFGVIYRSSVLLGTATMTVGFRPLPDSDDLLIRLENRAEIASQPIFPRDGTLEAPGPTRLPAWGATVLSVVVKLD